METERPQTFVLGIEDIPTEMLEKIFEMLFKSGSGLSLLRCREVCKMWKHRIEYGILKNKHWNEKLWYNICKESVPRNTSLEFLNIGPSRIKGNDEKGLLYMIQAINNQNPPDLRKLERNERNRDTFINLKFEDGCSASGESKWRRLFLHCMTLFAGCDSGCENKSTKHESKNFRTDTFEPDPVTSIKISGEMIITGHSTGTVWFWTTSGHSLDCIPVVQSGSELRDCIKSMNLVDAYQNGKYVLKDIEGHSIFTDHHAIALLSTSGNVYFCSLYTSQINNSYSDPSAINTQEMDEKFASRFKSISQLQNWKISCINVYGDIIIAGTSFGGKIFLLKLKTNSELSSQPSKVPELQSLQMLSFTDISPILSSGIFHCNLWHSSGPTAWYWQCITLIHRTGSVYRCYLPNVAGIEMLNIANAPSVRHRPVWKRFADIDSQHVSNSILFESNNRYDRDHVPFHLIAPYHFAQEKQHIAGSYACSSIPMKTIKIGEITYAILPQSEILDTLKIRNLSTTYPDDTFESCSIYRDDVFIFITRASKQMLISVDGYYYRVYSPLKSDAFCGSYISALYYSTNLLLLGTSDGRVRAYIVPAINGILNLDLDKPSWEEEAGIWSFGQPVSHIHVGLLSHRETTNKYPNHRNIEDESVSIVIAYENNTMTVIKRSLKFTQNN